MVPVEAAAKATRHAQVIITDGQASSQEDELKNLSAGADLVLLPTTPQARSVELTVELSSILRQMGTMHAALLVKVDSRKQRLAQEARQILEGFDLDVMQAEIPLLAAFEKAEVEGVCVSDAVDDRGRADLRRMGAGRPIARPLFRFVIACRQQRLTPSVLDQETPHFRRRSPIRQIFCASAAILGPAD